VLARAAELGLHDSVRILGWRDNIAEIMSCSDWFILPRADRPREGLGLAVLEAQIAGLRLLLSRAIPDDALLPTACVTRLSSADGAEVWAKAAVELLDRRLPDPQERLVALEASPFDLDFALADLLSLHQGTAE
jgi:hypothetical protein